MDFTISPSPNASIVLSRYETARFPKFDVIFEPPVTDHPLRFLAQPPEQAGRSVVMENRAAKDVTALRYRWLLSSADGMVRTQRYSSDSYYALYHPVLKPRDRKLICGSITVDESFIDHVLHGGGGIGGGNSRSRDTAGATALRFEIDMVLFADGELAGQDIEKYAAELQCRKPAAEFVAKQIRLAEAEGRDVRPVLFALANAPHLRDDSLAHWTQHFASASLSAIDNEQMWQARLRHLEGLPVLPKFYRPENPNDSIGT